MGNDFYNEIKSILVSARNKAYNAANFAMVEAYWNIGKRLLKNKAVRIQQNMDRDYYKNCLNR